MLVSDSAFAKFQNRDDARSAVSALQLNGISLEHISVMLPDFEVATDFGTSRISKMRASAIFGGIIGTVAGALVGFILFSAMSEITQIYYKGWLIMVGGLFFTFFSAITGAFVGLRLSKRFTRKKSTPHDRRGVLLSVHDETLEKLERARQVFIHSGAYTAHLASRTPHWKKIFANWEEVDKTYLGSRA